MSMPVSAAHCCGRTHPNASAGSMIRDNLHDRIEEAEREGWLGEVEGLKVSLAGTRTKLAQVEQMTSTSLRQPVQLGIPARTHP